MLITNHRLKGFLACLALGIPAYFLGKAFPLIGGPVFAILLGMLSSRFIIKRAYLQPGIAFTSKKVLQYAVILLGFGLNLATVFEVGLASLPIIISTIATALITAYLIGKVLNIHSKSTILIGVGSSICGGSAIAATAPVIDANDKEIAQAISVIFFFNILAALIFPTLGDYLQLSNSGFALFAGTAVNDTSSVTAVASSWDAIHHTGVMVLDGATIVKLTRTLAIIPITLVLGFYYAKKSSHNNKASIKKAFPMFILYFLIASLITTGCEAMISAGLFNETVTYYIGQLFLFLKSCSKFFIILAMGAIGMHTDLIELVRNGGKPIFMGLCCWIAISLVSLFIQHTMHLL